VATHLREVEKQAKQMASVRLAQGNVKCHLAGALHGFARDGFVLEQGKERR
jgi:hypothetical protein